MQLRRVLRRVSSIPWSLPHCPVAVPVLPLPYILYRYKDGINVICELLSMKHGDLELDMFSHSVLDAFIAFLCTN